MKQRALSTGLLVGTAVLISLIPGYLHWREKPRAHRIHPVNWIARVHFVAANGLPNSTLSTKAYEEFLNELRRVTNSVPNSTPPPNPQG